MNRIDRGEDYEFWRLLNHTEHALYRVREMELSKYGITTMQARLLTAVDILGEKATPTEIQKRLFRKKHTISSLVDRSLKKGLIKKNNDLNRKNMIRMSLTPKGQKSLEAISKLTSIKQILSELSVSQRQQLILSLKILLAKAVSEYGLKG